MNAGFFALRQEIFSYIRDGEELVVEPFRRLIDERRLTSHKYDGFWACMDTYKEKQTLDDLYHRGDAPWVVWNKRRRRHRCHGRHAGATACRSERSPMRSVRESIELTTPCVARGRNRAIRVTHVMFTPNLKNLRRVLCLGCHADDIEIGCGGSVLRLLDEHPGIEVWWVVLSGEPERAEEARQKCGRMAGRSRAAAGHLRRLPRPILPCPVGTNQGLHPRHRREVRARSHIHPPPRRCPSGSPPRRRAHLERLPKSSHLGIRDSQVRRRPGPAQRVPCARRGNLPSKGRAASRRISVAAGQAVVHRRHFLGAVAVARAGMQFTLALRRRILRSQDAVFDLIAVRGRLCTS